MLTTRRQVLTIPTAILGVFTVLTLGFRTWRLLRQTATCRPINSSSRWQCDFLTWNLILGTSIVTTVLATATSKTPPSTRQASLAQSIVLYLASIQILATAIGSRFGCASPVTLSSTKRGQRMRPGVFTLMEDVVAVDGSGGQNFRQALCARYEASKEFRSVLEQLNWVWGLGSLLVAVLTTILVFVIESEDAAFAVGE